ncbi:cytochrome P450 [Xylariaceae sp. FL1272]|nr:cytochrome P450 [Xylariaceae sp. FL1272]
MVTVLSSSDTSAAWLMGGFFSSPIIDQQAHRHKRKIIGQALNDRSMRIFEPIIAAEADVLIKLLYVSSTDKAAAPVNMSDRFEHLSYDIVTLLGFGHPLKLQTDETYRFMCKGMAVANYYTNTHMQFFLIYQLELTAALHFLNNAMREKYRTLVRKMVSVRMSEDKDIRHDLYSVTSKANAEAVNPEEGIQLSEVWSEAITFLPAAVFFFYLSRYPECYQRLLDEIRTTFASEADIKFGMQLSNCKYLRACIDETMRMSPSIPGTMWRELQPNDSEPLIFEVNTYSLHHNETYFPDSYLFNLGRWLDTQAAENIKAGLREAFMPFAIGYRDCVGKNMAYLVMSLVVAKIVWYFDFESPTRAKGKVGGGHKGEFGRRRVTEYQLYDIFSAMQ